MSPQSSVMSCPQAPAAGGGQLVPGDGGGGEGVLAWVGSPPGEGRKPTTPHREPDAHSHIGLAHARCAEAGCQERPRDEETPFLCVAEASKSHRIPPQLLAPAGTGAVVTGCGGLRLRGRVSAADGAREGRAL